MQTEEGLTKLDCITNVRKKLVPEGEEPHPYRRYVMETYLDMMRSIVATFTFRRSVQDWCEKGVDFQSHCFVPEVDPITQDTHHDRCDHGHMLKRIAGTSIVRLFILLRTFTY